jgi:hypothetical protein
LQVPEQVPDDVTEERYASYRHNGFLADGRFIETDSSVDGSDGNRTHAEILDWGERRRPDCVISPILMDARLSEMPLSSTV